MRGWWVDVVLAIGVVITVMAFAAVARRLLGREFGLARRLLAGVLAFVLATPIARAMGGGAGTRAMGQSMARHLVAGMVPGVRMFTDLFRLVSTQGLSVPPEVAAAFRALATLEGVLTALAPGPDLVDGARSFGGRRFAELATPETLRRTALDELATLVPMLRRLPRRVERIATAAEYGRLSVNVPLLADDRDRRVVTGPLHQVLLTFPAATAGVMAVLLLGTHGGPAVTAQVSPYQMIGDHLLVICGVLALRVLVLIFRHPD